MMQEKARFAMMNRIIKVMSVPPEGIRRGQAVWNIVDADRPDLTDLVRGTDLDPYYSDTKLERFFMWLGDKLKEEKAAEQ